MLPLRSFMVLRCLGSCSRAVVIGAALFASAPALGSAEDGPVFSFDGFGTFGVVHSDEHDADFLGDGLTQRGAGHTSAWSAEVDSRFGLQLSADVTPRWSAVVQVIYEQRHSGFAPKVEWANVRYAASPRLDLRVGRTVLPSFLASDHRKVGYSSPWVRPPIEVYGLVPITSSDGIDVEHRASYGEFDNRLQIHVGGSTNRSRDGGRIEARRAIGVVDTVEIGALTLRAAYQRADLTIESINELFGAFRQFGPAGNAIADRYDVDDVALTFFGVGAAYDPGTWFLNGEFGRFQSDSAIGERRAWYVGGGLRRGKWTPYATIARTRPGSPLTAPGLDADDFPIEAGPVIASLNAALDTTLGGIPDQQSMSIGTRLDVAPSIALKIQYDYLRLGEGSAGVLTNLQPGFEPGGDVGLVSLSVDFVF
jgi:hypothetical protein